MNQHPGKSARGEDVVLCVDLDGTLIRGDLLYETAVTLLRQNLLHAAIFPWWLCRGRAELKHRIASKCTVDPAVLPYNEAFVEFLRAEHERGRQIVLATASHRLLAEAVAEHLGIFSEVIATDRGSNLKGEVKAKELVARYGERNFDYAGDHHVDIAVWKKARNCIVVSSRRSLKPKLQSLEVAKEFWLEAKPMTILRALRVHQWVKNLLIFVPLFMAHRMAESALWWQAVLAFVSFSICASSVYLVNDMADLEADRKHPTKRNRPLASGEMSLLQAFALAPLLLLASVGLALAVGVEFAVVLGIYFISTLAYSFALKRIAVLDIVVLASLYTLRVLAGAQAVQVPVSPWLLAVSMFFFFSLACIKRFSELWGLRKRSGGATAGRGYVEADLELIAMQGAASGFLSVLVMALYTNSREVSQLYSQPWLLWLLCPLLLYWISRVWLLAHRGEVNEDPIVFAIRDKASYVVGLLCIAVLLLAV